MIERLSKLIIIVFLTTLTGCNTATKESKTYFGGKIINPRGENVILYNNYVAIDTFKLDADNKFLGEISNIKEGLYYFRHGREHQYLYLEPEDSILIRLNYWDFDESLVFSGKGAFRNNLLIDSYLNIQEENKLFNSYYDLDPKGFKLKADSILNLKLATFKEFKKENSDESENFLNIFKIALTYPIYGHVENYPMVHIEKKRDGIHKEINDDFYSHRKEFITNQDSIIFYSPYGNFRRNYMYNKVHSEGHKMGTDSFDMGLLETIAGDVQDENFKNRLLRQTFFRHFYRRSTCQYSPETFDTFLSLTSDSEDKDLVNNLLKDIKELHAGKEISNFIVTDYSHSKKKIKSVIKGRNSFVYFWNPEYSSRSYIGSRINYLSDKFPNIKFVGVRIDGDGKDRLKRIDIKKQYYLTSESEANKFLSCKLPRALIITKKGKILNGYASLSSSKTFNQLKELSKK